MYYNVLPNKLNHSLIDTKSTFMLYNLEQGFGHPLLTIINALIGRSNRNTMQRAEANRTRSNGDHRPEAQREGS